MHDDSAPLLRLVDITRRFPGVEALSRVSFDVSRGEVHALVGENGAGKTTLISILAGVLTSDEGSIELAGRTVHWSSPVEARQGGIVTVHQEAELFASLSVAENMALERGLSTGPAGWVRWRELYRQARRAVELVGESIDVRLPGASLGVAQRHMTQIAAAVAQHARVLVLDEPTSALTAAETSWLFDQLACLTAAGVGIIYISHRQEEIFRVADRITVLRDGRRVWSGARGEIDSDELIRQMVGRERPAASSPRTRRDGTSGTTRLAVRNVTSVGSGCWDVSLDARGGEILGIYGLIGSGRSEFARAVFGIEPCISGTIAIDGRVRTIRSPRQAVAAGLAYLPEDRLRQGVFRGLSVRANTVLSTLACWSSGAWVRAARERTATGRQVRSLGIKCRDVDQPLGQLSGGNQQKVVLARWMLSNPGVLLLDEPTRGVDVASKAEIHRILGDLADQGTAVVMISSDLSEVMDHADRIIVFRAGRVAGELDARGAAPEEVAALALPVEPLAAARRSIAAVRRPPRALASEWALGLAIAALCVLLAVSTDTFLSGENLSRLLSNTAMWSVLSLGAAVIILAGGIDISLGSLFALSAGVGGLVLKCPYSPVVTIPLAVLAALAVGATGGLLNAAMALAGRVHPIVVTLGTMTVYRGLLILLTGGETIGGLPSAFLGWAQTRFAGVDGAVTVCALAVATVYLWIGYRPSGRHLVALGSSPTAARLVGISRSRVWLTAFGAGGSLAALAGLVELAQTGSLQSATGTGYELQAIAAAVIGGVSISGGRGSVVGVCLGALLLSLIYNALVLWQISGFHYALVTGLTLLAAVLCDALWRRLEP